MSALLVLPAGALTHTVAAIRTAGGGEREAAVFWLGSPATLRVGEVILSTGADVELLPLSLRIGEQSMLTLAEYCERSGQVVLGAAHSHPELAFFSWIDADAFFHAVDCVSVVLPEYGSTGPERAESDWAILVGLAGNGWRRGSWSSDVEIVAGDCELVQLP